MSKQALPQIDFAKRYIAVEVSTFAAWSAIARLESLLEDIRSVRTVLEPQLKQRLAPSSFEFTAYYRVGFVTCLEWHAKSRLYDMYCFAPGVIRSDDIKQAISNDKLAQMVAEGLTIPHLIASSTGISSKEKYVAAISRVFESLGIQKDALPAILNRAVDDLSIGQLLDQLFVERNELVHEIEIGTIGHPNVRDCESFEEALLKGERIIKMLQEIEHTISTRAPANFPNQLGSDGYPVDEVNILLDAIKTREEKIAAVAKTEAEFEAFISSDWEELVAQNRATLEAQLQFIDGLQLAGWRYYDVRPFLKLTLLKQSLAFLDQLSEQVL